MKKYIIAMVLLALLMVATIGTNVYAFAEDTTAPATQEETNPTEQPAKENQFGTDFFGRLAEFIYCNTAEVIASLGTILSAVVTALMVFIRNKLIDGSRKANELTSTTMAQVGGRISQLEQQSGNIISSVNTMIDSYNKNSEINEKLVTSYKTTEEALAVAKAENEKLKAGMTGMMNMLRELALHANLSPTVKDIIDKSYIRAQTSINPQDVKIETAEESEDEQYN